MYGNVYCFNIYNEPLKLSVNSQLAGTIAGHSKEPATLYTPSFLAVQRALHSDDDSAAAFPGDAKTALHIKWDSFSGLASIDLTNLPDISLDDDLILYITRNQLILMTQRGFVLDRTVALTF